ncbi:MAG: site-specific integrase [Verrucomicrobiae bacterium]|nr:site-specific integrase [Verrucomicrobiae bacterium]
MKMAIDYERAARKRITETQARKVIQDVYERVTERDLPSQSVAEFLDSWIGRKRVELSPSSLESYKAVVADFKNYLGEKQSDELLYVSTSDVAGFRDSLAEKVTANTTNKKLKVLRSAFKAAWQDELISENPADRVATIKVKRETFERRAFNLEELKRLFDAARGEWRGMLTFGLYTGQRLGDIAMLTWQNVDLERRELRFSTQKMGRRQIIPLAQPVVEYLGEIEAGDDPKAYLFPECASIIETKGRTSMLSAQFYEIMVEAGLAKARKNKQGSKHGRSAKRETNELSFHSLRHSATSIMKNAGVSPAIVQEFIGHDSKAVSQNYTHIELEAMRRATDLMPDIFSGNSKEKDGKT